MASASRWHCFPTLLWDAEGGCGGVSAQEFCSAVTRVLLRSMIIPVSLFRSFLNPYFLYGNTKSTLMPAFVTQAKQKLEHNHEYSLLLQMHNFIGISARLWFHPGWRVTSVHRCVCCRLHEYLHPRHEYGDLKKTLIWLAEFQGKSVMLSQDSVMT